MSERDDRTPGEVLYEAGHLADMIPWEESSHRDKYEALAQSVLAAFPAPVPVVTGEMMDALYRSLRGDYILPDRSILRSKLNQALAAEREKRKPSMDETLVEISIARERSLNAILDGEREKQSDGVAGKGDEINPQVKEGSAVSAGIQELKEPWIAECVECGKRYKNHAGSTPCCGSVARVVSEGAAEAEGDSELSAAMKIIFGLRDRIAALEAELSAVEARIASLEGNQ